ncbi:MAG: hypothetical protein QXT00_02315 [Ignisphaera sp.]
MWFKMPSSNAHFELTWEVTTSGETETNSTPIPSVIWRRWLVIVCRQGSGTITVKGGVRIPEAPETIYWDTVASVSVTPNSTTILNISDKFPYHHYKVDFTPSGGGPYSIFVRIEGNA